jgi:hypothetical protein
MGLLDLLTTSKLGLQGIAPATIPSADPNSTLHFQSSINSIPAFEQSPSSLDLNGIPPTVSVTGQPLPYIDNLPEK